jgi:hypothetical protein
MEVVHPTGSELILAVLPFCHYDQLADISVKED